MNISVWLSADPAPASSGTSKEKHLKACPPLGLSRHRTTMKMLRRVQAVRVQLPGIIAPRRNQWRVTITNRMIGNVEQETMSVENRTFAIVGR
jgi:hypothetical protein